MNKKDTDLMKLIKPDTDLIVKTKEKIFFKDTVKQKSIVIKKSIITALCSVICLLALAVIATSTIKPAELVDASATSKTEEIVSAKKDTTEKNTLNTLNLSLDLAKLYDDIKSMASDEGVPAIVYGNVVKTEVLFFDETVYTKTTIKVIEVLKGEKLVSDDYVDFIEYGGYIDAAMLKNKFAPKIKINDFSNGVYYNVCFGEYEYSSVGDEMIVFLEYANEDFTKEALGIDEAFTVACAIQGKFVLKNDKFVNASKGDIKIKSLGSLSDAKKSINDAIK